MCAASALSAIGVILSGKVKVDKAKEYMVLGNLYQIIDGIPGACKSPPVVLLSKLGMKVCNLKPIYSYICFYYILNTYKYKYTYLY